MEPVRFLHCLSSFDLGGKEARIVQLMNGFGKAASHVLINANMQAISASKVIDRRIDWNFATDAPDLLGGFSIRRYRALAEYMRGFDLVLTYNWGSMDAVMAHTIFAEQLKLPPLVHHEDGFNTDEANKLKLSRNLFRMLALARAQALVVPSQRLRAIALSSWRQPAARLHHIVNGIRLENYAHKPKASSLPGFERREGEVVIGTLAGLREVKNLPRLVRVVADVARRNAPELRLVIVGDGPEKAAIEAEASACGIADRLVMPGHLNQPERFIGHFDIFALSSDSEQCPISVIEAMAAGLPVVAPDVGDIVNMVSQENRKLMAPSADEAVLADNLHMLVSDPSLRSRLGQLNQAHAHEHYAESVMLQRYAQLYGRLMKKRSFAEMLK